MTQQQYKEFREDFQSIVWYKGQISSKRKYISQLYSWDKDGSHQSTIDKATKDWNEIKSVLNKKLLKYGLTYEQMHEKSKEIAALNSRIKSNEKAVAKYVVAPLKIRQTKERLQKLFANLTISPII